MLQLVELLLQFHGTGPETVALCPGQIAPVTVALCPGHLVSGCHEIEDGTGHADGSGSVLLLPCRQADRHLDASLEPALGTAAALAVTLSDHADYSVAALIACRARLAALRRP